MFSREVVVGLHRISQGVPRIINILAHKMLMAAYGQGASTVEKTHLQMAAEDTEGVVPLPSSMFKRVGAAVATAVGAAAAAAAIGMGA